MFDRCVVVARGCVAAAAVWMAGAAFGGGGAAVSLEAGVPYPIGNVPVSVNIGDADGDLLPDVLTNDSSAGTITIRRGLGDGGLGPAVTVALPSGNARAVIPDDIDGDGDIDLVAAVRDGDGLIAVLEATGTLQYAAPRYVGTGNFFVFNLALADFDLDGDRDAAVAQAFVGDGIITTLRNDDGVFVETGDHLFGLSDIFYVTDVAAGDLNGDGFPDLAAVGVNSGAVGVIMNAGDGTFLEPLPLEIGQERPQAIAIADMNGDDAMDLVLAEIGLFGGSTGVRVALNDGSGGFTSSIGAPTPQIGSSFTTPIGLAVGDINGDGAPDVGVTAHPAGVIRVLVSQGDGTLTHVLDHPADMQPLDVAAADMDGDGRTDLVNVNALQLTGPGSVMVHMNSTPVQPVDGDVDGDGTVGVDDLIAVITAWGPCPGCREDITGDGLVDVDDLVAVILGWT